jgi:hypothetical protein
MKLKKKILIQKKDKKQITIKTIKEKFDIKIK